MKEISGGIAQTQTLRRSVNAASAAAALFIATATPVRIQPNSSQTPPLGVAYSTSHATSSTMPTAIAVSEQAIDLANQYTVTITDSTNSSEITGSIVVTPPNRPKKAMTVWEALAQHIGSIEAPTDWSENHDKYLNKA